MFDKNWRAKNLGISNRLEKEDVERAVRDPAIIHYTYKRKPWLAPDHPRSVEWLKCAAETSFFEQGYLDSLKPRVAKRSEEHTSELQSLMRISYAVFCLKKKKQHFLEIIKNTLCNDIHYNL